MALIRPICLFVSLLTLIFHSSVRGVRYDVFGREQEGMEEGTAESMAEGKFESYVDFWLDEGETAGHADRLNGTDIMESPRRGHMDDLPSPGGSLNQVEEGQVSSEAAGDGGSSSVEFPEVIAYIAGGKMASSKIFANSIETLGENGRWRRPVVVLTDEPECVRQHQLPRAQAHKVDLRIIEIPKPDWGGSEAYPSENFYYKLFKQQVWDYLEKAGFTGLNRVMYMDEDILVGRDMHDLSMMLSEASDPDGGLLTVPQTGIEGEKYHGGLLIMRNDTDVRDCLHDWNRIIRTEQFSRDQKALLKSSCATDGHIAVMPAGSLFQFPDKQSMAAKKVGLFMHFTNTYRLKSPSLHESVRQFMSSVLKLELSPWGSLGFECRNPYLNQGHGHGLKLHRLSR